MVNPLVLSYLKRRAEILERRELRRVIAELREVQAKTSPAINAAIAKRRRDGVSGEGFVMGAKS